MHWLLTLALTIFPALAPILYNFPPSSSLLRLFSWATTDACNPSSASTLDPLSPVYTLARQFLSGPASTLYGLLSIPLHIPPSIMAYSYRRRPLRSPMEGATKSFFVYTYTRTLGVYPRQEDISLSCGESEEHFFTSTRPSLVNSNEREVFRHIRVDRLL